MKRSFARLTALLAAGLLAIPCLAGEQQADDLIEKARAARAGGSSRAIGLLVRGDRVAAYEAIHRLGAIGDHASIQLALAIATAYADVYADRRPLERIPVFRSWSSAQRASRAEAVRLKKDAMGEYADGRPETALGKFETALATFTRIGDEREVAWCRNAIAGTKVVLSGGDEAIRGLEVARNEIERVGDLRLLGVVEHNLGLALRGSGDLPAAKDSLERSLKLARDMGDRREEAHSLTSLGVVVGALGDVDQEISYQRQAASIARDVEDGETEALARQNLAVVHRDRGEMPSAVAEFRKAAEIARRIGADSAEADAASQLSLLLRELGRTAEARGWLARAEVIAEAAQSATLRSQVACIKTMALIEEGSAEAAMPILDASVAETRQAGDPGQLSIILECRAFGLYYLGRYEEAVADQRAAADAASQSSDVGLEAWRRQSLGAYLAILGDLPGALVELEAAAALHERTKSKLGRCRTLGILGALRDRAGDHERARKDLEEALRCATESGQAGDRAAGLYDLANLELKAGPSGAQAALARLREASEIFTRQKNPGSYTECELLAAHANLLAGNRGAAKEILDRIAHLGRAKRTPHNEWRYQYLRARVAVLDGNRAAAIRSCERAVDEVERVRSGVRPPPWRAAILDDRIEPYRELVRLHLETDDLEKAYRTARLGKARDFARRLVPPSLGDDGPNAVASPRWAESVAQVSRLRALLRQREVLLDFFVLNDRVVVFVVKREGIAARRLSADPATLRALAEVARYPGRPDRADDPVTGAWRRATARLGTALLDPLAHDLGEADEVLVVPNAWLHSVPFPALSYEGRPLVERRTVALLPAAEALFSRRPPRRPGAGLLALGDPDIGGRGTTLPGAEFEIRRVASLASGSTWVRTGAEATEAAYVLRAPRSEYIHLAAHGRIDPLTPLRSRIELAGGGGADGRLTAEEIAALPVTASLVVLSGCETGSDVALAGGDSPGDEREGLVRAFLKAGAGTVVASLWETDDVVSADVFPEIYRGLSFRSNPAAAVSRLQRDMIQGVLRGAESQRLDHPFHWAGIVVYGAGR